MLDKSEKENNGVKIGKANKETEHKKRSANKQDKCWQVESFTNEEQTKYKYKEINSGVSYIQI